MWDLVVGKVVKEFKSHTAAVTAVQFHPQELLLATGSSDRTAIVWDLERLEPLSVCGPESTAIRSLQFYSTGSVLLTAAQDSLRVGKSIILCGYYCACMQCTYVWRETVNHFLVYYIHYVGVKRV